MLGKRFAISAVAAVVIVVGAQWLMRRQAPPRDPPATIDTAEPPVARTVEQPSEKFASAFQDADATVGRARDPAPAAESAEPPAAADGSRRFLFDCGNGLFFGVRTVPGEATLISPELFGAELITLPQVEAASGARYAFGDISYSTRGGLATFEIRDRTYADCTSNPGAAQTAEARRRSVTFRARGNEPSWVLQISRERIELATEQGARRIDFPYREPTVTGTRTTYQTFSGTQELLVVVDEIPCNDTLSGEAFESTVGVTFENVTMYGCGQPP